MERDRGFSFKLLVPPRVNTGQVSAVRPRGITENCDEAVNSMHQTYSKYFDKETTMPLSTKSIVTPATNPNRQDCLKMKVVPPMEKDEPGQLYSKLFDEVEKIKSWKVKVDTDAVQKERKLEENKRTIETQRKAIQELQFGNESLSIKLEEQISENEDLINKNNVIQNLCNTLKDTFERSAEKMHLFECEREETHHLFMENNESIQKLIEAFESLQIKAERDQHEVHKVKEGLHLQFEDLKEKYHQEYTIKEEEVEVLQTTLRAKENEIQKILSDLHQTKEHCKTLEDGMKQQYEHLQSSNAENESLTQKLQNAEQECKESKRHQEDVAALLAQNKVEYAQIIQSKDLSLQELERIKNQQAEELEQIQRTIKELQKSLAAEIQRAKEFEDELVKNNMELGMRNKLFGETIEQSAKKDEQIKTLEEQLDIKSRSIQSMNGRVEELRAGLSKKTEETLKLQNKADMVFAENNLLKKAYEDAIKLQEDFKAKLIMTDVKVQELNEQFFNEKKQNEEKTFETEQLRKDIKHHKSKYEELLSSFNELQSVKNDIQQQIDSGSFDAKALETNMKVSEEKAVKLTKEIERLEEEKQQLRNDGCTLKAIIHGKCQEIETLQMKTEDNWEHLKNEIMKKEKQIKAVETKFCNLRKKLETKLKSKEECQKENKILKKQIANEIANSHQQQNEINSLHEQTQRLKRINEEDRQKLLTELETKSAFAAELENEVQKLRLTATEAIKSKEDSDIKCQYKITDMVTLMEKNKSQYDRMVEEKDAKLDEFKRKEMVAVAHGKSLELELLKHETETDCLKKQLSAEITEKEKLQKELTHLKEKESYMKTAQPSAAKNKSPMAQNQTSSKSYKSDFSKTRKTPSYTDDDWSAAVMNKTEADTGSVRTSRGRTAKTMEVRQEDRKTTKRITNRDVPTSNIKMYRIRTPPSADKTACWGKSTTVFDPNSDSSDQSDILAFVNTTVPSFPNTLCKVNSILKFQSPVTHKSPGKSLKQAAMKRIRDAGWTAVTGCEKKKEDS